MAGHESKRGMTYFSTDSSNSNANYRRSSLNVDESSPDYDTRQIVLHFLRFFFPVHRVEKNRILKIETHAELFTIIESQLFRKTSITRPTNVEAKFFFPPRSCV